MNPISLKFQDKSIEARFQESTENKLVLQFEWLILSFVFVGIIVICIELANADYLAVGIYSLLFLTYVCFYFYIHNNKSLAIKYLKMLNNATFMLPILDLIFSIFNILSAKTQVAFILMAYLYAPLLNSSYNIVFDLVLIFISMSINIYHLSYIIGFTPYYFIVYCAFFQLSFQKYNQIKVERTLFSNSLVNHSLIDVIKNICKENIIIFTYNFDQQKYEEEIVNETAQSYFNTNILGDILKEIHLKNSIEIDIQSFIFRNCIQQQKRGEFQFKGYYKSKTNKILINLYVSQYQNIQIILKIEKKQNKIIKIRKAKQLIKFQLCFLQDLVRKFNDCFRMQERIDIKISKFYNYLYKAIIYNKLQIISIANITQIKINTINLEQLIEDVFGAWNLKYFLQSQQNILKSVSFENQVVNTINSSKIFLELLLDVVALNLKKVISNYEEFILIELVQFEDIIQMSFHFNSKNSPQVSGFLKESLAKLVCKVGLSESLLFQGNKISFNILKQLYESA